MARKAGVTREQVTDAASTIADRNGLAAVSVARVAAAVGVRPPSLYAHVDGLGGLRRALALRAIDGLTESFRMAAAEQPDPRATLRAIADAYRAFASPTPGCTPRCSRSPNPTPTRRGRPQQQHQPAS